MDELTKFLVKELIDGESVTAIYGGGFKPPTKGHFDLVKTALKDFKDIDKFIIYVGSGIRDGIEQEQALQIWGIYKELLPSKVQIEPSATPIGDIMRYAKNHPEEKVYFIIGYREGREDDLDDIKNRTKGVEEKYPNLEVRVIKTPSGDMSGTNARKALKKGDKEQFFTYLPTEVPANEKEDIYNILEPTVMKEGEMGTVQFDVLDNYNQQDIIDDIKNKFNKFISAVKQENKETKESVSLLIKAAKGNTTLTDEQKKEIGDQLKDVLRLIGLTAIATLPGGFIAAALIKLFKAESLITPSSFANEGSCGYDTDVKTGKQLNTPGGLEEADPKKGTGKKPKGSSRRLYTDEDPSDTVKVKFSTKQDIIDTFSKASFKSKPHARQSQVINLIHQRVRAAYERSKDPEVKKRLKTALDYAEQRKEASKEKTERLKKQNLNEQKQDMIFKRPKLNYSYTSLQPYIDKETMEEHFDKHFKGYTDKLNAELDVKSIKVDAENQIQAIQTILGKYYKNDIIRNNGGGFYNHALYFENMTPDYKAPSTKFREMLEENFNSFSEFKEQFKEAGLKQFGSGWVFLIKKGDKLVIESYANQDNPYLDKDFKGEILIAMDVWEHSYYLKHKSQRGNYIDDFFRVVDYKVAEERLEEEPITENVAPNHDGKSAPFGSGYKKVNEKNGFGGQSRYRAIEKRGDKYYYIQDNPFAPGIRQEFGPYKTKEQAKKKMGTFPPSQNYRDITQEDVSEGDTYEKMAAKGKQSGNLKQGTVRARLNIPKDEKVPMGKINKEITRLKKMDQDDDKKGVQLGDKNQKYYKALQLAKTLKSTTNLKEVEESTIPYNSDYKKFIPELTQYMYENGMNIKPFPNVKFITDDEVNAKDPLGITAFYDPANATIVLYTMGRHPKDILRSFAHEMVHHEQNLNKTIGTGKIKTTNTLEDDYLDKIEREAYEKGNIMFRNWTDSIKK